MESGLPAARALVPPALEEIERRLRYRLLPLLIFLTMMVALAVTAAISLLVPRRTVTGVPHDPEAQAAFELMQGHSPPRMGELRFRAELFGAAESGAAQPVPAIVAAAAALLARAEVRHLLDARLPAALAHLDLARRRFEQAERGYRRALLLAPGYGEARLGLGVALALHAEREADALEQRSLRLQAIAQFAAVGPRDPAREPALYDRVVLLANVGRRAEAERRAADYAGGFGGAWAESLAARLRTER